jgi:hypothetical protein
MKENTTHAQKRYLNSWNYNAAHILTELETIVKNNGGKLCRTWEHENPPAWLTERKQYLIENRSLSEAIHEEQELLLKFERFDRTDAARETRERIARYESLKREPELSYYGDYLYIQFVLDNHFYSFSMDNNPFFEFHFAKVKLENGNKINRNYYLQEDRKHWWNDCFWRADCSRDDIREAADLIYNMLLTSNNNRTYIERNRKPYTKIVLMEESEQ